MNVMTLGTRSLVHYELIPMEKGTSAYGEAKVGVHHFGMSNPWC